MTRIRRINADKKAFPSREYPQKPMSFVFCFF